MLRRRLTVLIEVYLSRKQHEHAAPLSKQLAAAVMESSLLPMPLLSAACEQCAVSVVEVLIAKKADVSQQVRLVYLKMGLARKNKCQQPEMICHSMLRLQSFSEWAVIIYTNLFIFC